MGHESIEVDLNKLRDLVKRGQSQVGDKSIPTADEVVVDRGTIVLVNASAKHQSRTLTRIDTKTPFAGRLEDEQEVVDEKFPIGTTFLVSDEGVAGWLYGVTCELGAPYTFWTYLDDVDGYYKTKVLEPRIEEFWSDPHGGHVYVSSGRLCLDTRYNGGAPTLESAFARTVLWATGFSIAERGETFPF
jgi:hypothetical protein